MKPKVSPPRILFNTPLRGTPRKTKTEIAPQVCPELVEGAPGKSGIYAYLKTRYNPRVHVITKKRLVEFAARYPVSRNPLLKWYRIVSQTDFASFTAVRSVFRAADQVGKLTVFDIGGNKFRIIAAIHYNRRRVYIRHVLTHAEYDKDKWKEK